MVTSHSARPHHFSLVAGLAALALLLTCSTTLTAATHAPTTSTNSSDTQSHPKAILLAHDLLESCPRNCSGIGTCLSSGACACPSGTMGASCNLTTTSDTPIYAYTINGLLGQVIEQEWRIVRDDDAPPYLHLRWCDNSDSWFGGIFNVGWNGMTSVNASAAGADTWAFWVSPNGTVYLADYYTIYRWTPLLDAQQSLTVVNGWRDDVFQCVEFTRPLDTGDDDDIVISAEAGTSVRFMWSNGLRVPHHFPQGQPYLTMHGMVGYVGQFSVDFSGGVMKELTDGMKWPVGYYYGALLTGLLLVLPFGLVLQRDAVKMSPFGRLLRSRPFVHLFGGLNLQEMVVVAIYIAINVCVVVTSFVDYDHIGRARAYICGHLLIIHMALTLLPASRNSLLLPLLGIGFDTAIKWHRRMAVVTVVMMLAHLITMAVVWTPKILFYVETCQFGMGVVFGTFSSLALVLVLLCSMDWVRRNHWEWFLRLHLLLGAAAYGMAMMHSITLRWLCIVPGGLLIIDLLMRRFVQPFVVNGGVIKAETGSGKQLFEESTSRKKRGRSARIVRVECHGADTLSHQVVVLTLRLDTKIGAAVPSPGSHFNLCVPEISLLESHPFTISSARTVFDCVGDTQSTILTLHIIAVNNHEDSVTRLIHCTPQRSFTQELYARAAACLPPGQKSVSFNGFDGFDASDEFLLRDSQAQAATCTPTFSLLLDGPYCAITEPIFRYRMLVLVAGGIGVTPAMSVLTRYMQAYEERRATAASFSTERPLPLRIYFLWSGRSADAFQSWFPDQMTQLRDHAPRVQVQLFLTGSERKPKPKRVRPPPARPVKPNDTVAPLIKPNDDAKSNDAVKPNDAVEVRVVDVPPAAPAVTPAAPAEPSPTKIDTAPCESVSSSPFPLIRGRPEFGPFFRSLATELADIDCDEYSGGRLTCNDVLVFSCGPTAMIEEAEREAERAGCHFTHEGFEY